MPGMKPGLGILFALGACGGSQAQPDEPVDEVRQGPAQTSASREPLPPSAASGATSELTMTLDGAPHPFAVEGASLCSELAFELGFTDRTTGAPCPEQTGMSGTGAPVSLGRHCQTLSLHLENAPVAGSVVRLEGSSHAQASFRDYRGDGSFIWSCDRGPSDVTGTMQIHAFQEEPDGRTFVRFTLDLDGPHDVHAEGWVLVARTGCLMG